MERFPYNVLYRGEGSMISEPPTTWREDLNWLIPGQITEGATWLENLNAPFPWRSVVGHIRLPDSHEIILKYHTKPEAFQHEWAVARFFTDAHAPLIAPPCLGAYEQRKVLAFDHLVGPELTAVLDGAQAQTVWRTAVQAIAELHQWAVDRHEVWLDIWPHDRQAPCLPLYDLTIDALLAPFQSIGAVTADLTTAITMARHAVAAPGPWLTFTHADLQTRHLFWTNAGLRIVDWERAGLRHRLYDLACLIDKPTVHGRRLPHAAEDSTIMRYARACGLDAEAVRTALIPVLTYERLIGIAEDYPTEPARARACLEGIITLTQHDHTYAIIGQAAVRLLAMLPEADLPLFAGFFGE